MTTIDPRTLKKGDRIRYSRVVTVERDGTVPSRYGKERIYTRTESGGMCQPIVDDLEIELLERPLPPEPPEGSVVIFHGSTIEAWKRWDDHLGWLHAGNSTPYRRDGATLARRQGNTWAELLAERADLKRTVIQP